MKKMLLLNIISFYIASIFAHAGEQPKKEEPEPPKLITVKIVTSKGDIVVELDAEKAPISVAHFLSYAKDGFYDGTIFHYVSPKDIIEGGKMTADRRLKPTKAKIKDEKATCLKNKRGTFVMDTDETPITDATSMFLINCVDHDWMDRYPSRYIVFGKVIKGMDVVDAISVVKTGEIYSYMPREAVMISSVIVLEGDIGGLLKKTPPPRTILSVEDPEIAYSYNNKIFRLNYTTRMLTAFEPVLMKTLHTNITGIDSKKLNVVGDKDFVIPNDENLIGVLDNCYTIVTNKHIYFYCGSGVSMLRLDYESVIVWTLDNSKNAMHKEFIDVFYKSLDDFMPYWKKTLERERSGLIAYKPKDLQWGDSLDVLAVNGFMTFNGLQSDAGEDYDFHVNRNIIGHGDPNAGVYGLTFEFAYDEIDEAETIKIYTAQYGEPHIDKSSSSFYIYTWNKAGIRTIGKFNQISGLTEIDQFCEKYYKIHEERIAKKEAEANEMRKKATHDVLGL